VKNDIIRVLHFPIFWPPGALLALDGAAVVNGILTIPLSGRIPADSGAPDGSVCRTAPFVAGPENRLAAVALRPYLEKVATPWNPLVLYGPNGSGKSHLACGLAAWWREHFPDNEVICCAASEFAQDFAAAVGAGKLDRWRRPLRQVDLLVLEDVGQLADKASAQQELIDLLDELAAREARVVVTSRALPSHLPSLAAGLRSRLSAGLSVPLSWPAQEARRAVLELAAQGQNVSSGALYSLADGLEASVPALLAALAELELGAQVEGTAIDSKRVRGFIAERLDTHKPGLHQIASRTAKYFGLRVSDLKSPRRRQPLVAARCVAMYLARELTDLSFEQIGAYFGGRDHTTVIYGVRRTKALLRRDRATRQAIAELKRCLSVA
jgi:chromosomal replication initiator protein